jgi:hypothetical protein
MMSNNLLASISYLGPRRHVTQVIVAEESMEGSLLRVADNLSKVIFSFFSIQTEVNQPILNWTELSKVKLLNNRSIVNKMSSATYQGFRDANEENAYFFADIIWIDIYSDYEKKCVQILSSAISINYIANETPS